jgi:hypothetical protein
VGIAVAATVGVGLARTRLSRVAGWTGPRPVSRAVIPAPAPTAPEALVQQVRSGRATNHLVSAASAAEQLATRPGWEARGDAWLGLVRDQQGDPAGAVAGMDRALRRDPALAGFGASPREVRKRLARNLLRLARSAEARVELRAVLDSGSDPEASWLLSRAFLQEDAIDQAVGAWSRAQGSGEDDPTALEPAPYVGAARCAECHSAIARDQRRSRHADTFLRGPDLPAKVPLPERGIADPSGADVTHAFHRVDGQVRVETRFGSALAEALVDYALGSGKQGVTLIGHEASGTIRELRLSHYPDHPEWDRTPAHPIRPRQPVEFLGKPLELDLVRVCLNCHTTNYRAALDPTRPEAGDRGIGCERCHGPGGHHVKAVAAGFPDLAIARPRLASAHQVIKLCGQCHKRSSPTPALTASQELMMAQDASAIRFQASSLVLSRCYTESHGGFDCRTCHNPHQNAQTSATYYEGKCLSCHAGGATEPTRGHSSAQPGKGDRVACPVKPSTGCLECHMPRVAGVISHAVFTDHEIRVRNLSSHGE